MRVRIRIQMASRIVSGHGGTRSPHLASTIITVLFPLRTEPFGGSCRNAHVDSNSHPLPPIAINTTCPPSTSTGTQDCDVVPKPIQGGEHHAIDTIRTTAHIPATFADHLDCCKSDYVLWIRGPNPPPAGVYRKCWNDDHSASAIYTAYPSTSQATATTMPCATTNPRKPYVCSAKHNAHNQRRKDATADRAKAWYDAHKYKVKTCYLCKKLKSISEFKRVRNHGRYAASGRCWACVDNPKRRSAYEDLCEAKGWALWPNHMNDI
jgi:hypothetical protein